MRVFQRFGLTVCWVGVLSCDTFVEGATLFLGMDCVLTGVWLTWLYDRRMDFDCKIMINKFSLFFYLFQLMGICKF